jgi:Ran GTPase-activating protein (RanGAP) involved in mRNA processing and transport
MLSDITMYISFSPKLYHWHALFSQTLTSLNLPGNQVGHDGAKRLAEALRDNKVNLSLSSYLPFYLYLFQQAVVTLDLADNRIGDEGTQHLMDALRNNTVNPFLSSTLSITFLPSHTDTSQTQSIQQSNEPDKREIYCWSYRTEHRKLHFII